MPEQNKIEIAVIEDNKLFRKTLIDFINQNNELSCNYSFSSCEEALREIKNKNINIEVILLDIGLPGMSGVQAIPFLREITSAKIVMLTIQDDDENVFNALCNGASGYLLKDSSSETIVDSVKEVIAGGAPMNGAIAAKVLRMFRDFAPVKKDYNLTQREKDILKLLVDGLSKKQIADKLFLSYHTVDAHIRNIYEKLEVHSGNSAVAKALKENLL